MKNLLKKIFFTSFTVFFNFNFSKIELSDLKDSISEFSKNENNILEKTSIILSEKILNFSSFAVTEFITCKEFFEAYLLNLNENKNHDPIKVLELLMTYEPEKVYELLCDKEFFLEEAIEEFKKLYTKQEFEIFFSGRLALEKFMFLILEKFDIKELEKFLFLYAKNSYADNNFNSLSNINLAILNLFNHIETKVLISGIMDKDSLEKIKVFLTEYSNKTNTSKSGVTLTYLNKLKDLKDHIMLVFAKRGAKPDNSLSDKFKSSFGTIKAFSSLKA